MLVGNLDSLLLETLNEQLMANGNPIHEYRKQLMQEWLPEVLNLYQHLAGQADDISIKYQSTLSDQDFKTLLAESLAKDSLLHRTNVGIHKDDLVVTIQNQPFKQEASQGQRKSLLFAIRLAEWMTLKKYKGFSPILLMDDIFEKLDENRMVQLLAWVSKSTDGQVFITDTHKSRVADLLGRYVENFQLIEL